MKAISMWQPWASLWLTDAKEHETRGRQIHHRGWLLVQAAKVPIGVIDHRLEGIVSERFGSSFRTTLPRGAIIGAVKIEDVEATSVIVKHYGKLGAMVDSKEWTDLQCGNFSQGRWGFRRSEFKVFKAPIPYRGMQAMPFEIPDDIVRVEMDW